jgi:hypothetical protein
MNRRRQLRSSESCVDVDGLLCVLRDKLGKADAFISTAEELVERVWEAMATRTTTVSTVFCAAGATWST